MVLIGSWFLPFTVISQSSASKPPKALLPFNPSINSDIPSSPIWLQLMSNEAKVTLPRQINDILLSPAQVIYCVSTLMSERSHYTHMQH